MFRKEGAYGSAAKDWSSLDEDVAPGGGEEGSRPSSAGLKGRVKSHSPTAQIPPTIHFFSGNPAVETTEGIIHIYKDR